MKTKCNCTTSSGSKALAVVLLSCLLLVVGGLLAPTPAAAVLPVPTNCQVDVQGVNDQPGQKDLTEFCVDTATSPYELNTLWSWDNMTLPGGNTGDACTLYDTDGDGLANLAVCVTTRDGGNPMSLAAVRLFTCNDTRPERCAGPTQLEVNKCVGGPKDGLGCLNAGDCDPGNCLPDPNSARTTCEVSQKLTDPFPGGSDYRVDSVAVCLVDLNDFGAAGAILIDACSYPSQEPNSDPSDCILFKGCTLDSQCDDGNACTIDTCALIPNTNEKVCKHTPNTGASCDDGQYCTVEDECNELGFCDGSPRDCNDDKFCTDDSCDEENNTCLHVNKDPIEFPQCSGGSCVPVDDSNVCTIDGCDEATGNPTYDPAPATTPCGDQTDNECNNPDHCSGTDGSCVNEVEPATTVCRPAASECDVAEYCDGAGNCPANGFQSPGTYCGGAGDGLCNLQDTCDGLGTCHNNVAGTDVLCRAAAGQCDVAEYCDGAGACPPDVFASSSTTCTGTSNGGVCDDTDHCSGTSNTCVDGFKSSATVCRDSAGQCDVAEKCTGSSGACPDDVFASSSTPCTGTSNGGACDGFDHCSGTANMCVDGYQPSDYVCRPGSGDVCDPDEKCTGTGSACPEDVFKTADYVCRPAGGVCDVEEKCTGEAGDPCPADMKEPCAFVTDSSLCQFDFCDAGGFFDPFTDPDATRQFRVLFTPDVKIYPGFKLNASNPGQFYYNAFVQPPDGSLTFTMTIKVPWPFVTQGATPVHVYDGVDVKSNGCFEVPEVALDGYDATWTMADWCGGSRDAGTGWTVSCDKVSGPNGSGFCTLTLTGVPVPESGVAYVNVHLDFGLKGPDVDGNPCDLAADRYDRGTGPSGCEGYHALVDTADNSGQVALSNLRTFDFSHRLLGDSDEYYDTVQNVNLFKPIAGAFGLVNHSLTGEPAEEGTSMLLVNGSDAVVQTGQTDEDGFYALPYKHTGKPAPYSVEFAADSSLSQAIELQGNGWVQVNFDLATGKSTYEYGTGRNKTKP